MAGGGCGGGDGPFPSFQRRWAHEVVPWCGCGGRRGGAGCRCSRPGAGAAGRYRRQRGAASHARRSSRRWRASPATASPPACMKVFGGELGKNTQAKPILQTVFRYRFNDTWIGTGEFGFGWNSFKDRGDTVLTFTFGTLGAARKIGQPLRHRPARHRRPRFLPLELQVQRAEPARPRPPACRRSHPARDAALLPRDLARRLSRPGERVPADPPRHPARASAAALCADRGQGPSSTPSSTRTTPCLSLRFGVTYHFSPDEGILWEGKKVKKIRLESGKEGR